MICGQLVSGDCHEVYEDTVNTQYIFKSYAQTLRTGCKSWLAIFLFYFTLLEKTDKYSIKSGVLLLPFLAVTGQNVNHVLITNTILKGIRTLNKSFKTVIQSNPLF